LHPDAKAVRDRLTTPYRFEPLTKLPAVQSVGSLTKVGRAAPGGMSESREAIVSFEAELSAPRCVLKELTASPTDLGSATHLVLQHVNFTRTCDRADLRAQVAELVRKQLIVPNLAEAVDLDPIVWLMTTPLGLLLRKNAQTLHRELPIYFPQTSSESRDPMDRVMVRGRVDVLVPDSDGFVIVDYKTDRVTEKTVDARAEFYRPQLSSYRDALSGMLNTRVKSAYLVFLTTQSIIEV
jgi:ATP-dependent helicase/nuclease subunit A